MTPEQQALLDALAEARLPPVAPSWVAILVLCLLVLLLVAALVAAVLALRRWRQVRARRLAALAWRDEADNAVEELAQAWRARGTESDRQRWLAQASVLARRVALVGADRADVAALTGEAWLARLDALLGEPRFQQDPVSVLAEGPYRAASGLDETAMQAILGALRDLIAAVARQSGVQA